MNKMKLSVFALTLFSVGINCAVHAAKAQDHTQVVAFLDQNKHQLHWFTKTSEGLAKVLAKPSLSLSPLKNKTTLAPLPLESVKAGGIGGNEKTGFIYYDGQSGLGHAEALTILRNPLTKTCYLQSPDVIVRDWNHDLDVAQFPCAEPDKKGLYWNPNFDYVNGAYNPGLDAFYAGQQTAHMYQSWFYSPAWNKWGHQTPVTILIHADSTYFEDGGIFGGPDQPWYVSLSDGDNKHYPDTTLDITAHYISVGIALSHWGYSWGVGNSPSIATSYSDALAKAVEFDIHGQNDWTFGYTVKKGYGGIRYMDHPAKDCDSGEKPGSGCSIETYDDFKQHPYIYPEYGAGLLNRVFYLIATAPGWDTKKTFEVLDHATYYWWDHDYNWDDPTTPPHDYFNFHDVFCSLITSARDLQYDQIHIEGIVKALTEVKMDVSTCK